MKNQRTAWLAAMLLLAAGPACGDDTVIGGGDGVVDVEVNLDTDTADLTGVTFDTTETSTVDDTGPTPDTTSTPDADVEGPTCDDVSKPFFCPCTNNTQCLSGYCVAVDEAEVAFRCSRTCQDACPNGWECRGIGGVSDQTFVCQPPIDTLCDACTTDAQCGAVGDRCVAFEDGDFCGSDCQGAAGSCPETYECAEITNDVGQITAYQCVPESGSCNCEPGLDYDNDPLNCGGCKKACAFDGGVPGCEVGECVLDDCLAGFVNLNGIDTDGCEYACTVTGGEDWPDAVCDGSSCDQDCDGIDGSYVRGVFVSATLGSAGGSGAHDSPVDTVTRGIQLASQTAGKDHIYIAAGTYDEAVTLVDGVSVFGGYSNDGLWRRSLTTYETIITSSSGFNSVRALIADGISVTRTVVGGLTVIGGTNANPGGSSYGVWIRNSTDVLEIVRVRAIGGNAGGGANGATGSPGSDGDEGQPGRSTTDTDADCNEFDDYGGDGGAAGVNRCSSGRNAAGGQGGNSGCGEDSGDPRPQAGTASPAGSSGGPAPSPKQNGNPGTNGSPGAPGTNGSGGLGAGEVSQGFWRGFDGSDGTDGQNGAGGGGGSGGGGNNGGICFAIWGGGGGGGAGGGCGGTKGTAGRAGGGSFGVFVLDSSPVFLDGAFGHKNGGNGGRGATGGSAGSGKLGGAGGSGHENRCYDPPFDVDDYKAGNGGKGGNGGDGGRGGHGGGGAGGVAYGLYIAGSSNPSCTGLSYNPPGAGGSGGLGGPSSGNVGAGGPSGDKNKSTSSCP